MPYDKERYNRYTAKLKRETREAYGDRCAACGTDDPDVLTVDHVDNGGGQHRRRLESLAPGNYTSYRFYRWLRSQGWPTGYQTLCWNCQWKKHLNK